MALSMQARTLSGATRALPVRRTAGAGSTLRSAVRGSDEWRRSPFTREDAVEAAWAVVDPVLKNHHRVHPYKHRSWGPLEADAILASGQSWHNPKPKEIFSPGPERHFRSSGSSLGRRLCE
jgi:hypothetical protein